MENIFTKKSFKLFSDKLYQILNHIIPGIVSLEVFFHRGFFSNLPQPFFEFILYIFWSFILSIPYNCFDVVTMKDIMSEFKMQVMKKFSIPKADDQKIKALLKNYAKQFKKTDSIIQFLTIIVYILAIFFINSFLEYCFSYQPFWNINKSVIDYCFVTLLVIFFIYNSLFLIVNVILKKVIKKAVQKITTANSGFEQ
jgi:preprotein translocase subunit SecG